MNRVTLRDVMLVYNRTFTTGMYTRIHNSTIIITSICLLFLKNQKEGRALFITICRFPLSTWIYSWVCKDNKKFCYVKWVYLKKPLFYTDDRAPWPSDQSVARPLPTHNTTHSQNKRRQTSMPWVGFELTIPVFERTKTVHALDRAATVIGAFSN
jgi:hypothetical protein